MMRFWLLLRRRDPVNGGLIDGKAIWDAAHGFVVQAHSEVEARDLAAAGCGDEGPFIWRQSDYTSCRLLTGEGTAVVLLRDFNAG